MKATRTPTKNQGRLPLWRQLRWSLVLYFILLAVLPIVVISLVLIRQSSDQAEKQVFSQLQSVATLKEQELERWLSDGQNELQSVVADPVRNQKIFQLLSAPDADPVVRSSVNNALLAQKNVTNHFQEFVLYTPEGRIVAASDDTQVGKVLTLQPYYQGSITNESYIQPPYYEIGSGELTMYETIQLKNGSGEVVGVMAARLNLDVLNEIMTERGGLGSTGETYLVSLENNFFLTSSRFEGYERTRAYHSVGIDQVLQQKDGSGQYSDYRGIAVFGVYRWVPTLQAGLVAEQDVEEALQAARDSRNTSILIGVIATLIAAGTGFILATRVSRPITYLTGIANRLAAGQLNQRTQMTQRNEVGVLGRTFDQMANQLEDLVGSLEARVSERTKDVTTTLEVGRLATSLYGREDFLPSIVEFIRESFSLYYVQVYLLDEAKRFAILRAGTGEAGQQLLARQHQLDMNETSLVARSVATEQPVVVTDTQTNPDHKPNPLLPSTRSEAAIPLIIAGETLGVLDMQSEKEGTFTAENLPAFGAMATQLAGILRATRALEETRSAVNRADDINRRLTRQNWEGYLASIARGDAIGFEYDLENANPLPQNVSVTDMVQSHAEQTYALQPITLRGETIGNIVVREDSEREWTEYELGLLREAAELVAQATEQYRTVDETEKRANELAIVAQVSATAASIQDLDSLLQTVADLTKNEFRLYHAHVYLLSPDRNFLLLAAGAGEPGRVMKASGHRIPVKQEFSLVARAARSRRGVVSNNVADAPDFLPNPLLPATKSELAVPMVVGDSVIGVLDVQDAVINRFTNEDLRVLSTLADQLAVAINNVRQFEATQRRLKDAQAVNLINEFLRSTLGDDEALENVLRVIIETLGPDNSIYSAFNHERRMWQGIVGAGSGMTSELAKTFQDPAEAYPHGLEAIERRKVVAVNNARLYPNFPLAILEALGIKSVMVIPLVIGNVTIGVIFLNYNTAPHFFTDEEILLAENISNQLSLSLERREAESQNQLIYDTGRALIASGDLQELLEAFANPILKNHAGSASLLFVDEKNPQYLDVVATVKTSDKLVTLPLGTRLSLTDLGTETSDNVTVAAQLVSDITDPSYGFAPEYIEGLKAFGTLSYASIPLVSGQRNIGNISLSWPEYHNFSQQEILYYDVFQSQLSALVEVRRLFEETQRTARQLNTVLGAVPVILFSYDQNGVFTLSEGSGLQAQGLTSGQLVGASLFEAYKDNPDFLAASERALQGEAFVATADIGGAIYETHYAPIYDETGTLSGTIGLAIDTTERERLLLEIERNATLLRSVLDTTPDWIFVKDRRYRFLLVNEGFAKNQGKTVEEVTGSDDAGIGVPEELIYGNPEKNIRGFRADDDYVLTTGQAIHNPHDVVVFADGSTHIMDTQKLPLVDEKGQPFAVLGFSRDVTQRIRTQQREQLATELGQQLASLLHIEDLFAQTVTSLSEMLGYYHVHIYVHEPETESLVVVEGLGEAGAFMKSERHRISMDAERSLVARSARALEPIIVNDVQDDPNFLPNPLLPYTQSEVAIPLYQGQSLIGVLDVQHDQSNAFSSEEVATLLIIANQLSVSISNVRQFERAEKRGNELEVVSDLSAIATTILDQTELLQTVADLTKESFNLYHAHIYLLDNARQYLELAAGAGDIGRLMVSERRKIALQHPHSLVALAARDAEGVIANDVTESADFLPNPLLPDTRSEMAIPMMVAGDVIGVLDVQSEIVNRFTNEDLNIQTALASQLAVAVTNARAFEERRRAETSLAKRVAEIEAVAQVGIAASTILDVNQLLFTVSNLTKQRFNLYHAHIYLLDDARQNLVLTAGAGEAGKRMVAEGRTISLNQSTSLVARAARSAEAVIANDVILNPDFLPNPLLPDTRSEMALPMIVGGQVIGVLDVQSDQLDNFSADDIQVQSTLASQLAVAVANASAFQSANERAAELALVNELGVEMTSILDPDLLVHRVGEEVARSFDLYHIHIFVADESGQELVLATGNGRAPCLHIDKDYRIRLDEEMSLVTRAAMERRSLMAGNVTEEPYFLSSPFLPNTRSELCLPMIVGEQLVGVIDIQSDKLNSFKDEDILILSTLASQIATAISNARAFQNVEAARAEVSRIFNLSADMIGSAGFDGYFKSLNPAWTKNLGWSIEELSSKPFVEFVHPDDRQRTLDEYASEMEKGSPTISFENRYQCKDGSYRWISWNATPILDEAVTYFVARDVTGQKDTERRERLANELGQQLSSLLQQEELLKETVEQLSQAFGYYHTQIYLVDEDGKRLVLSEGVGRAGEIMKQQQHSIPLRAERSLVARAGRSMQPVVAEDVALDPNYLPNPLLPYTRAEIAVPVFAGDRLLGVLDVQHNTPGFFDAGQVRTLLVVASQLAVALSNAELYAEQLRTTEQLRELDRLKNEFLASMSHELRTPLNSIIGYAEVILDGLDGPLNEEMEEDVHSIHQSGKLLLSLINDILDLAKIEAGQMELEYEPVDISAFLAKAVESSNILVKDKHVEMRSEVSNEVRDLDHFEADPIRLQQIVNNLLSNAAKFTEQGSITAKARIDNGSLVISIVDTGMGIAQDKLDIIFERFRQADQSSTRRAGGTGLGLAITRQLIQMHGGDIWVESEIGKGTSFSFSIPLERRKEPAGD
ncbi:MAG: GAF domain-containing protein [Chloroflexi bacterium]|nr:GAF domain-containing protein [Chloroflexota bacterium]